MNIHLFAPGHLLQRTVAYCPVCERRRRFVVYHCDNLYLGAHSVCCGCGDSWDGEGEMMSRPFARGWRKEAIERARRDYRAAAKKSEFGAWFKRAMETT